MKNLAGFRPKFLSQDISGRMQYAPTRVHEKPGGFYTQTFGEEHFGAYAIRPYTDTPKSCPVLDPNRRRGYLRGVCNTPLHGYMKNLAGFTFPHPDAPKNRPVLHPILRRGYLRGVCNTPLHGYVQNLASFRRKSLARGISGRMLLRPYTGTCKI